MTEIPRFARDDRVVDATLPLQNQGSFTRKPMITGVHAIIYSKQAEAVRAFFRDTLGRPSVDAGRGWLIFALPPAELGIHPTDDNEVHELYLMCDDVEATVKELAAKGVTAGE